MSRRLVLLAVALIVLALPAASWAKAHPLVGTWRLVGTIDQGRIAPSSSGFEEYKVVTNEYFMWTSMQDGVIVRHAGGAARLGRGTYQERVDYSSGEGFGWLAGHTFDFDWKLEGSRWFHRGILRGDHGEEFSVAEVWERVTKPPPPPGHPEKGR